MTTITPVRIESVSSIAADPLAWQGLLDGLGVALTGATLPGVFDAAYDAAEGSSRDPEAVTAWTGVQDEVIAEVAPAVAALLETAIERRLPWSFRG